MLNIDNESLVSILVPAFKEENYIKDCLNSIYAQSYKEIELIIMDDCSPDNTYEKALEWRNEFGTRFIRCVVIKNNANMGISKNFNTLLSYARGGYIKFIAADDMLFPDTIEKEVNFLNTNSCEIVFSNCLVIDETYQYPILLKGTERTLLDKPPHYENNLLHELLKGDFVPAPTVMTRGTTYKKYGKYREDLAFEDWEYWLRLASKGCKFGYIDEPLVAYRVWSGSYSHYSSGKEAEIRFRKNKVTEEKILNEYSVYDDAFKMDNIWNDVISACLYHGYIDYMDEVLTSKRFKIKRITRLKLLLYRMKIYQLIVKIVKIYRKESL